MSRIFFLGLVSAPDILSANSLTNGVNEDKMLQQYTEEMPHSVASGQLSVIEAERFSDFLNHQRKIIKDAEWKQKWGGMFSYHVFERLRDNFVPGKNLGAVFHSKTYQVKLTMIMR